MALRFSCPSCHTEYELDDSDVGEAVECECGAQFVVSAPTSQPAETSTPLPESDSQVVAVACPGCGSRYELAANELDAALECECGTVFEATPSPAGTSKPAEVPPSVGVEDVQDTAAAPVVEIAPDDPPTRVAKPVRAKSAKSSNLLTYGIVGGVSLLAVLLLVRLQMSGDSGSSSKTVASTDEEAGDTSADGSDEPKKPEPAAGEAEQPQDGEDPEVVASVDPEPDTGGGAETGNSTTEPTPVAGSSNPNELTDPDEFVLAGGGPTVAPDVDAVESTPTTDSDPVEDPEPAADPEPAPTTPTNAAPPAVVFVPPDDVPVELDDVVKRALEEQRKLEKAAAEAGRDTPEWRDQLAVVGGWLNAANARLQPSTDPRTTARVRLLLARACLDAGRNLDAGILGWSVATTAPDDLFAAEKPPKRRKKPDPKPKPKPAPKGPTNLGAQIVAAETGSKPGAAPKADEAVQLTEPGRSAGMIALAGLVAAYDRAPASDRTAELHGIVRVAEVLHERWPDHEQAADVALHVGELLRTNDRPADAITWYKRVPKSADEFARARLLAGQSMWTLVKSSMDPAEWDRAATLLEQGVATAGDDPALADNVVIAKLTLAQLRERQGRFDDVVNLLAGGSPSVVDAVASNGPRPPRGVRSAPFARLVFATLLDAQIRTDRLDEAGATMQAVAGVVDDAPALAVDLAKQLAAAAPAPDDNLAEAIEPTLAVAATHAAAMSTASLLSGAETATAVANDLASDADRSRLLHGHAVAFYEALLTKGLSTPESTRAVQFRLAAARTASGDGKGAVTLYDELLAEQPNVFAAQFEAATALLEWGGAEGDVDMLSAAIRGAEDKPHLWGFSKLSGVYRQLHGRSEKDEDLERFLDCRIGIARVRLEIAEHSEGDRRTDELEAAIQEIETLQRQFETREGNAWTELEEVVRELRTRLEG